MPRRDGDTEAGCRIDRLAVDLERLAHVLDDAGGKALGLVDTLHAGLQDGEFVAAETGHHVGVAHAGGEAFGDGAEQRVAGRMAERVVHRLEVIEVEAHDGQHGSVGSAVVHRLMDALAEGIAVGQAGEAVVPRHVGDARLHPALLGHVLEGGDPAAVRHGLLGHGHDAAVGAFGLEGRRLVAADILLQFGREIRRQLP